MSDRAIETLFDEQRRYPPPPEFAAQANAQADIYDIPFEEFWARQAHERVTWFEPFETLLAVTHPYSSSIVYDTTSGAESAARCRRSTGWPLLSAFGHWTFGCSGFGNGLFCMNPALAFASTSVFSSRKGGAIEGCCTML